MSDRPVNGMTFEEYCTHNCNTCSAACDTRKHGPSFFDRLEMVSDAYSQLDEDEVIRILNETVAEWEKEMDESDRKT